MAHKDKTLVKDRGVECETCGNLLGNVKGGKCPKCGSKIKKQYGMEEDYDKDKDPKVRTPKPDEPMFGKAEDYMCRECKYRGKSKDELEAHQKSTGHKGKISPSDYNKDMHGSGPNGNKNSGEKYTEDKDKGLGAGMARAGATAAGAKIGEAVGNKIQGKKKRNITKPIGKYKNWDACKADGKSDAYCGYLEHHAKGRWINRDNNLAGVHLENLKRKGA